MWNLVMTEVWIRNILISESTFKSYLTHMFVLYLKFVHHNLHCLSDAISTV